MHFYTLLPLASGHLPVVHLSPICRVPVAGSSSGTRMMNFVGAAPPLHNRFFGAVAQLGERRVRNAKVRSSILLGSTKYFYSFQRQACFWVRQNK